MIKVDQIHKRFGDLKVLKGLSFEIPKNTISTIVGSSGAGKSTILQIMGTLMRPDSGSVTIGNQDITDLKGDQLNIFRNLELGFIFQSHHLLPEFTAIENIMIPGLITDRNRKEIAQDAAKLLDMVGLSDRATHKPNELSGGEQQRVAVARSLVNRPSVIFADEPTGSLDSKNREEIYNIFELLRDQLKQTFVIVTHDIEFADRSDLKIEIKDGIIR